MEVFSLLKYWKGGGGGGNAGVSTGCSSSSTASFATADDDDGGPFFDLEFDDEEVRKLERETEMIQEEEEDEDEQENGVVRSADEMKSGPLKNPDSPIRTARKLRVLMLRLKRSKSESTAAATTSQTQNQNQNQHKNNNSNNKKLLTVKFEAEVPIISLLSRATSNSKVNTEQQAHESCNAKRMNKREAVQKYLQMVKRVPKRHQAEHAAVMTAAIKRLNLRKSKSAVVPNTVASKRRDDSLLEQEDGIQSAILHCKRSLHASKDGN